MNSAIVPVVPDPERELPVPQLPTVVHTKYVPGVVAASN